MPTAEVAEGRRVNAEKSQDNFLFASPHSQLLSGSFPP